MAGKYNMTIEQNSTFYKEFQWQDSSYALINLTPYTPLMQIRDSSGTLVKDMTTNNNIYILNNKIVLSLKPNETSDLTPNASYAYDILLKSGTDSYRLVEGKISVSKGETLL